MIWLRGFILSAAIALISSNAIAAPRCIAEYNSDTHAVEDPSAIAKKGEKIQITQMRVDKHTGAASFCAHGDYCYPTSGLDIITPCKISALPDPDMLDADVDEWFYYPE